MPDVSPYKSLYELGDMPVPGYTVTRYIGSGSFGQVWEADGPGDVQVAIKILNFGGAGQEREFKAIELVKKIRNPFLVPIFGIWLKDRHGRFVGEASMRGTNAPDQFAISTARDTDWSTIASETSAGDTVYMPESAANDPVADSAAMQMIVAMGLGETSLHDRLREMNRPDGVGIPGEKLLEYMEQISQGIDYLNLQCGIIHRDIKPHNMLLVGDVAQVCDFGLAKRSDDIYNTVANMLTAAYCAPEAFDTDLKPTPALDQYALAISYYELRTGKLPFSSSSIAGVMKIKLTGTLNFDCVPPEEATILRRATAVDPKRRFASCREFIRALRDQYSAAILPSPPPPPVAVSNVTHKTAVLPIIEDPRDIPTFKPKREHVVLAIGGVIMLLMALAVVNYSEAIILAFTSLPNSANPILRHDKQVTEEEIAKNRNNPSQGETKTLEPSLATVTLPETVNSLGMKFVVCPPGTFLMGSPPTDIDASDNEKPAISVTFTESLQLGKYEVTQREWKEVMNSEPWAGKEYVQLGNDIPASYISWHDAIAFCKKLTAIEQKAGILKQNESYRLPTEAEWEYACRAGTNTRYAFDDNPAQLPDYAWFGGMQATGNTKQELYPHRVGQKLSNPWGLFDMHGNVREWCEDIYQNKFSAKRDPALTKVDALRVLRGGAWSDDAVLCRAAARDYSSPASAARSNGFRIVREAEFAAKKE